MKKLLMMLVLMPLMGLADKETVDGIEWTYTVKDGKARIEEGLSQSATGSITIPSMLGGCPVTSIGDSAFCGCSNLTSVTIPASLTNVCRCAFSNCGALRSFAVDDKNAKYSSRSGLLCSKDGTTLVAGVNGDVTIPSSVANIGTYAFGRCSGLKTVEIPSSVVDIGFCAFYGCSGLKSFSVSSDNPSYSSHNGLLCSKDGAVLIAGVNGNVTIPDVVTSIGECAFQRYEELVSVAIPSSVTNIGVCAFSGCVSLLSARIPSSVRCVECQAFLGCRKMRALEISKGVTRIGEHAFFSCDEIESVTIPQGVTSIGDGTFCLCRGLKSVMMPSGLISVGKYAFSRCNGLSSVMIPSTVTSIGEGAFSECGGLKTVVMSSHVS